MAEQEEEKIEIKRLAYREMGDKSIAKTFRGILRVAHVLDCEDQKDDRFFNAKLYGVPTGGLSSELRGSDSAYAALAGGTIRYKYKDDPYKHKSVPVTDSMGNYLNFNLSADSVTFGSDEENNGSSVVPVKYVQPDATEIQHDKTFPVLKTGKMFVGYEKIEIAKNKDFITGGSITVEKSPYVDGVDPMLIIDNNFNHTEKNNNGKNYTPLSSASLVGSYEELMKSSGAAKLAKRYRTIFKIRNHTPSEFDGLVHFQDDVDINNFNIDKNNSFVEKTHDAFVDAINVKQYIRDKVSQYMQSNMIEVPSGMIIAQYIDLHKWYGIGEEKEIGKWKGNQPPMGQIQNTDIYEPTMIQGVVRKGYNQLVAYASSQVNTDEFYVPDTEVSDPMQYGNQYSPKKLKEVIPIYKRDYTICNGDTFTIHVMTPDMKKLENYYSYERFMDLFFAIGYQYTDFSVIRPHYENDIVRQDDGNVYNLKGYIKFDPKRKPLRGTGLIQSTACKDKDLLFTIDLVAIQAMVMLYTEIQNGTGKDGHSQCLDDNNQYSRDLAEQWLKKQPFPAQYIFNSPIPSNKNNPDDPNAGFTYTHIFPNYIKNPDPNATDDEKKEYLTENRNPNRNATEHLDNRKIAVYIGAEVNSFNSKMLYYDHKNKKNVVCKVWQTAEVQMALDLFTWNGKYREQDLKNYFTFPFQVPNMTQSVNGYETGAFVGSGIYQWTEENKYSSSFPSVVHHTNDCYPHRHIIFWGPEKFERMPFSHAATYTEGDKFEYAKRICPALDPLVTSDPEAAAEEGQDIPIMATAAAIQKPYYDTIRRTDYLGVAGNLGVTQVHWDAESNVNSYDIAEMAGLEYKLEAYNGGPATYVIHWRNWKDTNHPFLTYKNHPDPRWRNAEPNRGTTSGPFPLDSNSGAYGKDTEANSSSGGTGENTEDSTDDPSTEEETEKEPNTTGSSTGKDDWQDEYPPGTEIPEFPEITLPDEVVDKIEESEGEKVPDGGGEESGGGQENAEPETESGNSGGTSEQKITWFNPENVQLVYLIKL